MKQIIEWKEEYLIGISIIDEQHKHIFDITNTLYNYILEGHSNDKLSSTFSELYFFISDHFNSEEVLMKTQYTDFSGHIEEHNIFKEKITNLKYRYEQGDRLLIGLELLNFLKNWLLHHIVEIDDDLRKYYNKLDNK